MLSYPYVWLTGGTKPSLFVRTLYQFYLLAICFLFYGGFWVRGGQTLGMRTWRIKLVRQDGGPITWTIALKRFALCHTFFALSRSGISVGAFRPRQTRVA